MYRKKTKWIAKMLGTALFFTSFPAVGMPVKAEETIPVTPDYLWDFESVTDKTVTNAGGVSSGDATLRGTAAVTEGAVASGTETFSQEGNHVLHLAGGSKGSSYVTLPSELYQGVTEKTGVTWSFWMKPDSGIEKYTRVFSSVDGSGKNEFAFTPFADDKVWNLLFDDTDKYFKIFSEEPAKNVWNLVTISVSEEQAVFYVNGERVSASVGEGGPTQLKNRLKALSGYTTSALGKTCSTWSDADCKIELDDVAVYKRALSDQEVADLAGAYGFEVEVKEPKGSRDAAEGVYEDGTVLSEVSDLKVASPDGKLVVKLWKDEQDTYYYSASKNGKTVLECAKLGIVTKTEDLSEGLELAADSAKVTKGREQYELLAGSSSKIDKEYNQLSFDLTKGKSRVTVVFRVFEDGMAYRYEVDSDTEKRGEITTVTGEMSEFSLPDKGKIWTIDPSITYEAYQYSQGTVAGLYNENRKYSTPLLAELSEDSGNAWVLLSEANVYNEEEPYCASIFETKNDRKNVRMKFGSYLVQEQNAAYDKKKYSPSYKAIESVSMTDTFHTPWRVAVIADDLEKLADSSLIYDLNPDPDRDYSWVKSATSVWSWWSTTADAIDYNSMFDYIDFAAESGFKYCLVDYGWEIWPDYQSKIRELVEYADERDISLFLWYGVNKFDAEHIFDLDSAQRIEEAFAWCEEMGVKGVKVDYINSDSQYAMRVMYDLADLAAEHHLVLDYHGCTNPNGESRTFPNVISSEAVAGMENYKWSDGPTIETLLTLPYTRNVIGSMEFTPTCYRVNRSKATSGFLLAMPVVYESALQTFAHSAYVYPGYQGLSFLADVPADWDESLLPEGYPGESAIRVRRKGENWYLGAMTLEENTYTVKLDFLDPGEEYQAYIYKDNEDGSQIEIETQTVTADTKLQLPLLAKGGCAVKFSKYDPLTKTIYDDYDYYEAEDSGHAKVAGKAKVENNEYASNLKVVSGINGSGNTLTFSEIPVQKDGTYELKIYFASADAKDLYVKVNEEEPEKLTGIIGIRGDRIAVGCTSVNVELEEGDNTIVLYNDKGAAPNIDRIAVRKYVDGEPGEAEKNREMVKAITNEINKIGTVTAASKAAIEEARKAYNALSDDQKRYIPRDVVKKLTDAESAYQKLAEDAKKQEKKSETKQPVIVKQPAAVGTVISFGGNVYTVTNASASAPEVMFKQSGNKKAKKVTIPASVTDKGITYKVTAIGAKAFNGNKNLKTITIKSTTLKRVGKNAFKGIHKKAVVKVPKKQKKAYIKLFKKKGLPKTAKVK